MKKTGHSLVIVLALVGSISSTAAFAARDAATMIAQEKENQKVSDERTASRAAPAAGTPRKIVLPLDHGPRAETTPGANRKRLSAAQAAAVASSPVRFSSN